MKIKLQIIIFKKGNSWGVLKLEQIASLIAFHYLDHKDILLWQVHLVVFLNCILFSSTILKGKNEFYAKFHYSACFVWGFFFILDHFVRHSDYSTELYFIFYKNFWHLEYFTW